MSDARVLKNVSVDLRIKKSRCSLSSALIFHVHDPANFKINTCLSLIVFVHSNSWYELKSTLFGLKSILGRKGNKNVTVIMWENGFIEMAQLIKPVQQS